jgi:hypothetical protein
MICTTFAQRTGQAPARARVGACRGFLDRSVAAAVPVAVGFRRFDGIYHPWQPKAVDPLATPNQKMSITCHTRTLGTRTT